MFMFSVKGQPLFRVALWPTQGTLTGKIDACKKKNSTATKSGQQNLLGETEDPEIKDADTGSTGPVG